MAYTSTSEIYLKPNIEVPLFGRCLPAWARTGSTPGDRNALKQVIITQKLCHPHCCAIKLESTYKFMHKFASALNGCWL